MPFVAQPRVKASFDVDALHKKRPLLIVCRHCKRTEPEVKILRRRNGVGLGVCKVCSYRYQKELRWRKKGLGTQTPTQYTEGWNYHALTTLRDREGFSLATVQDHKPVGWVYRDVLVCHVGLEAGPVNEQWHLKFDIAGLACFISNLGLVIDPSKVRRPTNIDRTLPLQRAIEAAAFKAVADRALIIAEAREQVLRELAAKDPTLAALFKVPKK